MITIEKAILSINPNASMKIMYDSNDNFEIEWLNDTAPISKEDILAKQSELQTSEDAEVQAKENLKASAKTKLMAGEPLTEEEASLMIGG